MKTFDRIINWLLAALALVVIAFLIFAFSGKAHAASFGYEYRSTCTASGRCDSYFGPRTFDNSAKVIALPPMTDAQRARDSKWEEFCQPTKTVDKFGVTRLTYAKPGCEYGRSQ